MNKSITGKFAQAYPSPVLGYNSFEKNFLAMLNKHSLLKIKVFRSNHELYVSKASRKAIMKISYLVKLNFKAKKKERQSTL